MKRRILVLLLAILTLALVILASSRSDRVEPTLVPTKSASEGVSEAASPTITPTAIIIPTETPTFTPTATATPTPTPTPLPGVLIERAQAALRYGDYGTARKVFEGLPTDELEDSEARETLLGLARSLLEGEDYQAAAGAAADFLDQYPEDPQAPEAHFIQAEALVGAGDYVAAVDAYRAYLAERDVIAPYVLLWIGDVLTMAGEYEEAVEAYEQALFQSPDVDLIYQAREKMALALNYLGEYDDALTQLDAILAAARDINLRARIQYQAAQTLLAADEREAAYARYNDLVANYYKTAAAYDALVDLVNSGQEVDDFQRGRVDYYNDAPDAAIAAFYRAIETDLEDHPDYLHYYAGLTYRDAGNFAAAILEFDKLIDTHPGEAYVDDAWLEKAWTQYRLGDSEAAVATYTRFVADNPFNGLAPEALWWAANIHFWNDEYEAAERLFVQLASDYRNSEHAADALYRAAFCRYRMGDYQEAAETWQRYDDVYPSAELIPGAHFWRGRAHLAAGETVSATAAFEAAVAAGPLDYYSQRAQDYLSGLDPGASAVAGGDTEGEARIQPREPFVRRAIDLEAARSDEAIERAAADGWLAGWMGLSHTEAVTVSQPSPTLAADGRLLRGQELWRLGRRAEAKEELERLRIDTATDLQTQYQLAIIFRDLGLYRSSILAANAAIRVSPARSPFDAPKFLARLAYPTYFADLVLEEAEANDLDPALLFALIYQESLFEGFATSFAAARGLMQIIPPTGQSIANSLGWTDYDTSDLYRPFISVKFGSWYLAEQRDRFDALIYPALSAYNAGPGNAQRWLARTLGSCVEEGAADECPIDFDVFVELIDLVETRLYIRQIYKHFAVYQYLYGSED